MAEPLLYDCEALVWLRLAACCCCELGMLCVGWRVQLKECSTVME